MLLWLCLVVVVLVVVEVFAGTGGCGVVRRCVRCIWAWVSCGCGQVWMWTVGVAVDNGCEWRVGRRLGDCIAVGVVAVVVVVLLVGLGLGGAV